MAEVQWRYSKLTHPHTNHTNRHPRAALHPSFRLLHFKIGGHSPSKLTVHVERTSLIDDWTQSDFIHATSVQDG
eukprot:5010543-Pleurochrysis_carterae.AAC.1